MKLAILLLSLPLALGYKLRYQGFSDCGVDGWFCATVGGKLEITYKCSANQPTARVWVWTARFPERYSVFTVRDCKHLEVHMDCTKGLRTTLINRFNVINVTYLEILPPTPIFLHDNDQIPQAPPFLYLQDVGDVKLYPGVFDKPGGTCRYKYIELTTLTLNNVHMESVMKNLFYNQNMDKLIMKEVTIDSIESNAMTINADVTIERSSFPNLPINAITFKGENITLLDNTFRKIQTSGLTVKCKRFQFSHNLVDEVSNQGLDILGANIEITRNIFNHLETEALQRISPGYSPVSYELASKFVYDFSENLIRNLNPGSLHLNWEVYKKVCSDIIFHHNIFDCSCTNLGWISVPNGLGPKILKVKEFYDVYFNKGESKCIGHDHCPLDAVIAQIQDVCNNKTNVSTICASFDSSFSDENTSSFSVSTTPTATEEIEEEIIQDTELTFVTEKVPPVLSYMENQTSHFEKRTFPIWIVVPIIVVFAAICTGILIWYYKKKKQRQVITTLYKNEKGVDADSLIVINERHNELYDKQ